MKTMLKIVPIWTGTPMRMERRFKWELEFTGEYYTGTIESEKAFESAVQAYDNLMELQGDDTIYTILNLSDCIDTYKEQHE